MAMAVIVSVISSSILPLALLLVLVPVVYEVIDDFGMWIAPKLARFVTPCGPADEPAAQA